MIQDEKLWDKLYKAAEVIYKHMVPGCGFYAGTRKQDDGTFGKVYNQYAGAAGWLESKLYRKLTLEEQAVLAIAVGDRSQKCLKKVLSQQDIDSIFSDLWDDQPNRKHDCIPFERLVTGI
jgi:hypothetical protein